MRIPNPIATTTTEAYLAYRAGFLAQADLKEKLYHPYLHIDGWLAYWTGLTSDYPTDKNGDPECLTDEETYIAYLAGVTSEYPEAIKDPADVRVASYLKYLISARFGRPDYPVTREELYLSMMKPAFIPSGDPSSSIELDGTVEAPFVDVKMYGDTYQQTYSGKNLIDNTDVAYDFSNVSSSENHLSTLPTGIRYRTTYSGSGSPVVVFKLPIDLNQYIGKTIRMRADFGLKGRIVLLRVNSDVTSRTSLSTAETSGEEISWVVPESLGDNYFLGFNLTISAPGGEYQVDFTNLILTIDNPDMSYEPFVGGTASPNPDYPQEIQTVTGEQTVSVSGKNLFNIDNTESGGINTSGVDITAAGNWRTVGYIRANPNTTYTFSVGNNSFTTEIYVLRLYQYDENHNFITPRAESGHRSNLTITTGANTKYLRAVIYVANTNPITLDFVKDALLMLEEGSTPTAYEPYQSQSYELNLGKNLFNGVIESGGFDDNGFNYSVSTRVRPRDYIMVHPNTTYTLQGIPVNTTGVRFSVWYYSSNDYETPRLSHTGWINSPATFTTPAGCNFVRFMISNTASSAVSPDNFTNIQLELGSTSTPYAPYFEPIELCKIGDYQDYIYKSGDDWYVHKEVGKLVLDGSENWWRSSATNLDVYGLTISQIGINQVIDQNSACPHFIYRRLNAAGCYRSQVGGEDYLLYLCFDTGMGLSNITLFKTWLTNNNVTLYYALATPIDTQITDENLLAQLDALKEGGSYNDKTYIKVTATDPNLPGLLYVEAAV